MARHDYVIALVLPAELVEMLLVIGAAAMALDAHVARGMVAVVPVEANGEVAAEFPDDRGPQHLFPFLHEESGEGEFQDGPGDVDQDAHLHGNEVEYPGGVAHLLRQFPEFLHIGAAPDAFQVYRLAAERIGGQGCGDLRECRIGQQFHVVGMVVLDIIIDIPGRRQQLPSQVDGDFEVAVIAAADDQGRGQGRRHSQVDVLAPADAQDTFLGRDVQIDLQVIQSAQRGDQAALTVDDGHFLVPFADCLLEGFCPVSVQKTLIAAFVNFSEKEGGIFAAVPAQMPVH